MFVNHNILYDFITGFNIVTSMQTVGTVYCMCVFSTSHKTVLWYFVESYRAGGKSNKPVFLDTISKKYEIPKEILHHLSICRSQMV